MSATEGVTNSWPKLDQTSQKMGVSALGWMYVVSPYLPSATGRQRRLSGSMSATRYRPVAAAHDRLESSILRC